MIEEEFYKTFGIKKQVPCKKCSMHNTGWNCSRTCLHDDDKEKIYPPITDRILLKLLCLLVNNVSPITFIAGEKDIGIKNIKNLILETCIKSYEIREQVQKLFESEEE